MSSQIIAAAVAVALSGCFFEPIDLSGRQCPCAADWVCSPENICVQKLVDAGTRDALDGGGIARDTVCDEATFADVRICDGFEGEDLATWSGGVEGDGMTTLETATVYRGRGAIHSRIAEGGEHAKLVKTLDLPITTGTLHYRFYLRIASTESYQFFMIASLVEPVAPFGGINLSLSGGRLHLQVKPDDVTNQLASSSSGVPQDRWVCIQADVVGARDATGSVVISVDRIIKVRLDDVITLPAAGVGSVQIGAVFTNESQSAAGVWIDDYAFNTTPLPCD